MYKLFTVYLFIVYHFCEVVIRIYWEIVLVQVGYSNLFFWFTGLNNLHNLLYFRHKKRGRPKNIVGLLRLSLRFIKSKNYFTSGDS